jgi:hypothetical protein
VRSKKIEQLRTWADFPDLESDFAGVLDALEERGLTYAEIEVWVKDGLLAWWPSSALAPEEEPAP